MFSGIPIAERFAFILNTLLSDIASVSEDESIFEDIITVQLELFGSLTNNIINQSKDQSSSKSNYISTIFLILLLNINLIQPKTTPSQTNYKQIEPAQSFLFNKLNQSICQFVYLYDFQKLEFYSCFPELYNIQSFKTRLHKYLPLQSITLEILQFLSPTPFQDAKVNSVYEYYTFLN